MCAQWRLTDRRCRRQLRLALPGIQRSTTAPNWPDFLLRNNSSSCSQLLGNRIAEASYCPTARCTRRRGCAWRILRGSRKTWCGSTLGRKSGCFWRATILTSLGRSLFGGARPGPRRWSSNTSAGRQSRRSALNWPGCQGNRDAKRRQQKRLSHPSLG